VIKKLPRVPTEYMHCPPGESFISKELNNYNVSFNTTNQDKSGMVQIYCGSNVISHSQNDMSNV